VSSVEATGRVPPIIAVVGSSESGKTTLIEALVSNLRSHGYRVATIKHATRELSFDRPYKDSWRHIRAGSEATLVVSVGQVVLIKPILGEVTLEEAVRFLGPDYDVILAEGFKRSDVPKIKVCKELEEDSVSDLTNLIAVVSSRAVESKVRVFSPSEVNRLTDFLEEMFLKTEKGAKDR